MIKYIFQAHFYQTVFNCLNRIVQKSGHHPTNIMNDFKMYVGAYFS